MPWERNPYLVYMWGVRVAYDQFCLDMNIFNLNSRVPLGQGRRPFENDKILLENDKSTLSDSEPSGTTAVSDASSTAPKSDKKVKKGTVAAEKKSNHINSDFIKPLQDKPMMTPAYNNEYDYYDIIDDDFYYELYEELSSIDIYSDADEKLLLDLEQKLYERLQDKKKQKQTNIPKTTTQKTKRIIKPMNKNSFEREREMKKENEKDIIKHKNDKLKNKKNKKNTEKVITSKINKGIFEENDIVMDLPYLYYDDYQGLSLLFYVYISFLFFFVSYLLISI